MTEWLSFLSLQIKIKGFSNIGTKYATQLRRSKRRRRLRRQGTCNEWHALFKVPVLPLLWSSIALSLVLTLTLVVQYCPDICFVLVPDGAVKACLLEGRAVLGAAAIAAPLILSKRIVASCSWIHGRCGGICLQVWICSFLLRWIAMCLILDILKSQ